MTVRARVMLTKRVPAGQGVSYGHTYRTGGDHAGAGAARVRRRRAAARGQHRAGQLAGANRPIAGRVCMDQIVVDCGDDEVAAGDVAVLFGPGDDGEPTADDWAEAAAPSTTRS